MPAVDSRTLRVHGLRELARAFAVADKELAKELHSRLKDIGQPIATDAERRALSGIRNIGIPWSRMRVGVTQSRVYVAPRQRGGKGARRRPNLAGLLMDEAMSPALDAGQGRAIDDFEELLDRVGRAWERA